MQSLGRPCTRGTCVRSSTRARRAFDSSGLLLPVFYSNIVSLKFNLNTSRTVPKKKEHITNGTCRFRKKEKKKGKKELNLPVQVSYIYQSSSRTQKKWRMTTVSSWRDVIAERTPERHAARAKILAFFSEAGTSRAVVFPDDQQDGGGTGGQERTFTSSKSSDGGVVRLVGTCNGLLCLRDDVPVPGAYRTLSSTIAVANPITGEKVAIPQGSMSWEHYRSRRVVKYSFG